MSANAGELARLQRDFHAYVLDAAPAMLGSVVEDETATAQRRLDVYHQAYRLRLAEILRDDFSGVLHLLGDEGFEAMALAYIESRPSPYFNVRWYGDALASFLRDTAPWSQTPALAQMAGLEWQMTLAFDAVDQPTLELADIGDVAPEHWPRMCFDFAESLRRCELDCNVAPIRRAIDLEQQPPQAAPLPEPQTQAIWRADFGVRHRTLAVDEAAALAAAIDGACFAELCALLCNWHGEDVVAMRAAELLKSWIHDQWIVALTLRDEETDGDADGS